MKILHVSPFYVPLVGGAVTHFKELSERLVCRGHDVTVLTTNVRSLWDMNPRRSGGLPDFEVIGGVKVIRLCPSEGFISNLCERGLKVKGGYGSLSLLIGKERLELLTQGFRMFATTHKILQLEADIVASMNWYCAPAYYTYLARKLKRFKMVGIPLFHTAESWADREIHKRMLASCDAIIANTDHEAHFIRQRAAARVEVAGVGVCPTTFKHGNGGEIRKRYEIGSSPTIGFVGRLIPQKGASALLRAMRTVWMWNPDVRLVLAGSAPPGANKIHDLLQGLAPKERARIVQIRDFPEDEKASIYDAFDVFVLPSIGDSFGIVYLEAWLSGKPVIGARIGSTQSVIHEGVDGLLVEPEDHEDIARAIVDLLSDPIKRQRLGENGRAKTMAQFTWAKVTDKVEQLYLELFAAKATDRVAALRAEG